MKKSVVLADCEKEEIEQIIKGLDQQSKTNFDILQSSKVSWGGSEADSNQK